MPSWTMINRSYSMKLIYSKTNFQTRRSRKYNLNYISSKPPVYVIVLLVVVVLVVHISHRLNGSSCLGNFSFQ